MPLADPGYFPGMGNSVSFFLLAVWKVLLRAWLTARSLICQHGLGRSSYAEVPEPLASALSQATNETWPHSFVVTNMQHVQYKHYPPANHFHMVQGLNPARLQYWMD